MEPSRKNVVHLLAGGAGGTVGAIVTCPLEVVKTRLQSSVATFHPVYNLPTLNVVPHVQPCANYATWSTSFVSPNELVHHSSKPSSAGILVCLRFIVKTEGVRGLFKGLGPNLVGVAPSRAIYFCTYAQAKQVLNQKFNPNTPIVHILSALSAGFCASTATNPIWFVKTRLQLDQKREGSLSWQKCIRLIYEEHGMRGFYKGITASYFGVTETVIHFLIYESLKARLLKNDHPESSGAGISCLLKYMIAGAISKTCATTVAYPHEVARTRLRQEGSKYRTFIQTILLVAREEGHTGLYRGLVTQLVRQIPNTAIMMATYELVVHLLSKDEKTS
ncbi:solute carrier family 25 member 36-A-like [Haliotis cracherodii]|uniref:solute carrier family 25 member 36-A-like n=1 Tax=Haliotis cracherodii TaxID=6455 RepID=UPI0039EAECB1